MRSAVLQKPRALDDKPLGVTVDQLTSFGEDACGHIFMTGLGGGLFRLDGDAPPTPCTEQAASDATPPTLALSRRRAQRALRQKGFIVAVTCNEACGYTVSGRMRVSGSRTRYVLRRSSKLANAGTRVRVRLAMSTKARRALQRTLARGRRASVTIMVDARDGAGNATRRRVSIRARR
jgi:hypothetical protein